MIIGGGFYELLRKPKYYCIGLEGGYEDHIWRVSAVWDIVHADSRVEAIAFEEDLGVAVFRCLDELEANGKDSVYRKTAQLYPLHKKLQESLGKCSKVEDLRQRMMEPFRLNNKLFITSPEEQNALRHYAFRRHHEMYVFDMFPQPKGA